MRSRILLDPVLSAWPLIAHLALWFALTACAGSDRGTGSGEGSGGNAAMHPTTVDTRESVELREARETMVERQIRQRGIRDSRVLHAMLKIPRHRFVRPQDVSRAYEDRPLRIDHGQTISQPYIVALMTESAALQPEDRVLEVGTGSGYQAAVLGELAAEVYTIEIIPELAAQSAALLRDMGYGNVQVRHGDGFQGWPEKAPFDAIVVTAAPATVPQPLVDQLADGGRLVIPVGRNRQELLLLTRRGDRVEERRLTDVLFVPMTGEAEKHEDPGKAE